jgi:hypothetical protein
LRGFTNERGEFLLTTLPVVEVGTTPTATTIPHFADGGGWTTQVALVNPGDTAMSGTIQFLGATGQAVQTSAYALAPRSSTRLMTSGAGVNVQTGSVRISPGPSALTIFSYRTNGVSITQAGVPALPLSTAFRTYVESAGAIRSGLAIANPSSATVDVTLELAGNSATLSIPANGQRAMFLNEISGFGNLQGVLRVSSATPIALTSLRGRTNERGEFIITTTTPVDESAASSVREMFVPHFAEGGGYSMQFILFGRATSGTMYFVNQSGNATLLPFGS